MIWVQACNSAERGLHTDLSPALLRGSMRSSLRAGRGRGKRAKSASSFGVYRYVISTPLNYAEGAHFKRQQALQRQPTAWRENKQLVAQRLARDGRAR